MGLCLYFCSLRRVFSGQGAQCGLPLHLFLRGVTMHAQACEANEIEMAYKSCHPVECVR